MIRVWRGPEPRELVAERRRELARAILHWSSSVAASFVGYVFKGYREAAWTLYQRQFRKCAFCERLPGWENQPVEHFRPKGGAKRGESTQDPHHYWWLAWSWENLFFACTRCNGALTKANHFPLQPGSRALPLPTRMATLTLDPSFSDLDSECPLLLDPSRDDPMQSIAWEPSNAGEPWEALVWRPYGVDDRGRATIEILELHGPHAGDVSTEIQRHLTPKMLLLRNASNAGDLSGAEEQWTQVLMLFAPEAPYLAAMYDACCWFLDQPDLTKVASPRLSQVPYPSDLSPVEIVGEYKDGEVDALEPDDPPELAGCSDRLILQLRAKVFAHNVREGVLALCSERSFDEPTLARLLDCELPTVQDHRRDLMKEKLLREVAPGRYHT